MRIYLAHGASGSVESMRPWVTALARRGFDARPVGVPRGTAERALPVYREIVEKDATMPADDPGLTAVVGGQSFGGRVASMLAAERPVRGLILLSYPLHRPGHPEQLRVGHWPRIKCPVLLLSGESDPFARIDLLREETQELSDAELVTYPGVGHGLLRVIDQAVPEMVDFLERIAGG